MMSSVNMDGARHNFIRTCLALLLAAAIFCPILPAASAEDPDKEEPESPFSGSPCEYTLNGMTWEELSADFMTKNNVKDWQLAFGYYNTVTGEEHFWNGDSYYVCASIYKLPLCMKIAEKIKSGELDLEGHFKGFRLKELIRATIEASSNATASVLMQIYTKPKQYLRESAEYLDIGPEILEDPASRYMSAREFNFTPRQVISCLKHIYFDQDTYGLVLDHMRRATPSNYFLFHEQEYEIAHKYGYLEAEGYLFVNDCGICFTDEPICIVMFTKGLPFTYRQILADYCTLMCDYAQAAREQHLEAEAEAAEAERLAAEEAEQERLAKEQAAREAEEKARAEAAETEMSPTAPETVKLPEEGRKRKTVILILSAAGVLGVGAMLIGRRKERT